MGISKFGHTAAVIVALVAGTATAGAAHAAYFVRPVLQYQGALQDGLSLNDKTSDSQTFNDSATDLRAHVDLADATIKTFLQTTGPSDAFVGATGVMGDQIRYTGSSEQAVSFVFDYDAFISASQEEINAPEDADARYIRIEAYFAVYEAGSGATWDDWTRFGTQSHKALYVSDEFVNFEDRPGVFGENFASSLGIDLFLTPGKSYEIFSAFNLLATPGSMPGQIEMNSLNTSRIGIVAPGGSFTSQSGKFLGFAQTAAIPEPATWAMMIVGFGFAGSVLRHRRAPYAA